MRDIMVLTRNEARSERENELHLRDREKPVEKLRGWVQDKRKRKLSDPHKIRCQADRVDARKADKSQYLKL